MNQKRDDKIEAPDRIAITGPRSRIDRPLFDAYFAADGEGLPLDQLTPRQAMQLRRNKYSVLPAGGLGDSAYGLSSSAHNPLDPELASIVEQQLAQHTAWQAMLVRAKGIFERAGADFVLMKALSSPFAMMSDIDFLVPNPLDISAVVRELELEGFALYRFRLLAHPLKVMAVYKGQSIKTPPAVDIYPDAMWIRKHVIDGDIVLAGRYERPVRGLPIWGPCPEDDLYLVATHAFSHGDISLGELDHGARLAVLPGFDWDVVLDNAERFGCLDGVCAYLGLLQIVCDRLGKGQVVPANVLSSLERRPVCAPVAAWLRETQDSLAFPARVPLWLGTVHSALHHFPAVSRKLKLRELAMDAAVHGFTVGTHIMRRD